MDADPVADAGALVAESFPHAVWALVTGSVLTGLRTAGSDLDIVVCLPDGDPDAPHRDSRRCKPNSRWRKRRTMRLQDAATSPPPERNSTRCSPIPGMRRQHLPTRSRPVPCRSNPR